MCETKASSLPVAPFSKEVMSVTPTAVLEPATLDVAMLDAVSPSGLALESASHPVSAAPSPHPLAPLSGEEIAAVVALLKSSPEVGPKCRFVSIALHEPSKDVVAKFHPGDDVERAAFVVLLDNADGKTYEAVVSISSSTRLSWKHIPNVQPTLMLDEFFECEDAVKADSRFQEALRRRGIEDFSLLMIDPWSAGNYENGELESNLRLSRAMTWVRNEAGDNGYAHPVEGLFALVDLNTMTVVDIEDNGVTQIPTQPSNYAREYISEWRQDLKPLEITQPQGASFQVDGYHVKWQKWDFRIGFTPREGLVLHDLAYTEKENRRGVLYRASLVDMVVPYGDPHINHARKNAFDCGEYGIGMLAHALQLGCDCLGEIKYFDAYLCDSKGQVVQMPNVVCMHEEDYGIGWKHVDWRTNITEVRRSRRLVISFICTVGNYEYGFFWYLYQDGTIQFEIKLTGIMNLGALPPGETRPYGTMVGEGVYAPNHQHAFNVRLDMNIDGAQNTAYEVHSEAEPMDENNPFGNAFKAVATPLKTEQEAIGDCDSHNGRYWKIVNNNVQNALGQPTAFKLMPGENVRVFAHDNSSVMRRAGYMKHHFWVTPFDENEKYAAGDYPNQRFEGDGLPQYTLANRAIENTDIVVWYTFTAHHIPRPEDYPVMPCGYIGFMLKPVGFFHENPMMDVQPTPPKHSCCLTNSNANGNGSANGSSNGCH